MAVQNSTVERPAPHAPALSVADELAHQAASYVRPARKVNRSAARTRICQDTIIELSAKDARTMSLADFDRLASAQAELGRLNAGSVR
ncbi:hypothetical protein [Streptomyces poriferorum]|uniref:Uncharacterized protein n=1 Tax=Streptomyces poriferorum TaxID=2798799 RepID=A0ABY9J165_9ACTN|nr:MULTISPECIES: hypothetical protein [unclassified Streptomyces]MDP5310430.1 hypothetical protein [Streptomyces sp. Alt4]WLQ60416.1 hypothetical protein P8A19_35555 [Streptomyces sp. Alt2]